MSGIKFYLNFISKIDVGAMGPQLVGWTRRRNLRAKNLLKYEEGSRKDSRKDRPCRESFIIVSEKEEVIQKEAGFQPALEWGRWVRSSFLIRAWWEARKAVAVTDCCSDDDLEREHHIAELYELCICMGCVHVCVCKHVMAVAFSLLTNDWHSKHSCARLLPLVPLFCGLWESKEDTGCSVPLSLLSRESFPAAGDSDPCRHPMTQIPLIFFCIIFKKQQFSNVSTY